MNLTIDNMETEKLPTSLKNTASILTITVKDDERTHKTKHLVYDSYMVNPDDPILKEFIGKAVTEFNGDPTDVVVRISLDVL